MADRALHIAVDGRELLVGKPTGVGRYLFEMLRAWTDDSTWPHRLSVVLHAAPAAHLTALGPRVDWIVDPAGVAGTRWEQTRLARALGRLRPDVFFAAGYTAPLRLPCPFVVAIYDVSFWAHPEWFRWREGVRRRFLTRRAARRAARIVTISAFSADEIVRYLGVPRDTIAIAPPGAPERAGPPRDGVRDPMVLFAGSLFNRRHVPELIAAFARTARDVPAATLELVGDNRTSPRIDPIQLATSLDLAGRVTWRQYVTDAELDALYARARVFAFLSDYEGFAMTPLEATSHGVPPVLLDTSVAREVYGEGARLVPLDPAAISAALTDLLRNDAAHRRLVQLGEARLSSFSWTRSAAVVRQALETAVADR